MSTAIEQARELFKDEVVTNAISRDVELPHGAGTAVLITLDNGHDHTKPNTFGPGGLLSLDAAIEAARTRTDIVAVAVTGKPFIFAVGADLTGVPAIRTREQALAIGKLGHDVFRKLGEMDVPTFALVNGAAMGGGVEVALHCTYRTISSGVPALALPEAFLGLVPGWGGTYLLPNLIGAEKALKVIIDNPLAQNKMLKGPQAFEMASPTRSSSPPTSSRSPCAGSRRSSRATSSSSVPRSTRARPGTTPSTCPGSRSRASCTAPPLPRPAPSSWSPRPGRARVTRASPPRTRRSPTSS